MIQTFELSLSLEIIVWFCYTFWFPIQFVTLQRGDGLKTGSDHCILVLNVNSGYQPCGLVE